MRAGSTLLIGSDLMMCLAYSNPSINALLVFTVVLRQSLPCRKSEDIQHQLLYTNGAVETNNHVMAEQLGSDPQSMSTDLPSQSDDQLFVSVV